MGRFQLELLILGSFRLYTDWMTGWKFSPQIDLWALEGHLVMEFIQQLVEIEISRLIKPCLWVLQYLHEGNTRLARDFCLTSVYRQHRNNIDLCSNWYLALLKRHFVVFLSGFVLMLTREYSLAFAMSSCFTLSTPLDPRFAGSSQAKSKFGTILHPLM